MFAVMAAVVLSVQVGASAPLVDAVDGPAPAAAVELVSNVTERTEVRPLSEYILYGVMGLLPFYVGEPLHIQVAQGAFLYGLLTRFLAPVGAYLWMQNLFFNDVPDNDAGTIAFRFGVVGTLAFWAPVVVFLPLLLIPFYGWFTFLVFFLINAGVVSAIFNRAIMLAVSDAKFIAQNTGQGKAPDAAEDEAPKKRRKVEKAPPREEEDAAEEKPVKKKVRRERRSGSLDDE